MQIAEKWQLPPFRLGMSTAEEPLVEFRSSGLAGLIGPIQRELFGGTRKHVHKLRVGRASRPLGGSASAKAGPKSSESEAAVCRISSSPKETVSRALGLGNRKSCTNSTGEKAWPVCSLSISSSSASEPQVVASRDAAISREAAEVPGARRDLTRGRGGAWGATGKN